MRTVILMMLMLMLPAHVGAQPAVRLEGSATAVDPAAARALAADVRAAVRVPSSPGHRALVALHNRPLAAATVSAGQSTEIAPVPTVQHTRKTRISRSRRIPRKPTSDISSQLLQDAARLSVKQEPAPAPGANRVGVGSGKGGRLYAVPATGGASKGQGAGKGQGAQAAQAGSGPGSGQGNWSRGGGGSGGGGTSGGGVKGSGVGGSGAGGSQGSSGAGVGGSFKSGGSAGSGPGAASGAKGSSGQRRGQ